MQVKYKIGAGAYTLLFDETAGDSLEEDAGVFTGILDDQELCGGNSKTRFPRGNVEGTQQFQWNSVYATPDAARAAVLTVGALKMQQMHLQITEGATVQYLPNAVAAEYRYSRTGCSVRHTLTFKGDDLTTTAP